MASLNRVELIGNLGTDPEFRTFPSGGRVAGFRLATSEKWKSKETGETKERTEWHTVQVFADGLVGIIERYVKKGSKIYISGRLETRKWQDQAGNDRYSTEVVLRPYDGKLILLDRRQGDPGPSEDDYSRGPGDGKTAQQRADDFQGRGDQVVERNSAFDDLDDSIPF